MKSISIIIFLFLHLTVLAQEREWHIVVTTGIATYSMEDFKEIQNEFITNSGLKVQPVASFPPFLDFHSELGYSINENYTGGIRLSYTSTGGRVDYQDYSGLIRFDQLVNCIGVGTYINIRINASDQLPFSFNLATSWLRSNASFESQIKIGDIQQTEKFELFSNSLSITPSVNVKYSFKSKIFLMAYLGYELNVPGKVSLVENPDLQLINNQGDPLYIQWSGIRAGVGVGIRFKKENK